MLRMASKTTVVVEMAYAENPLEDTPQTLGISGRRQRISGVGHRLEPAQAAAEERFPLPHYSWANPAYETSICSIVSCQADLIPPA